MRQPEQQKWSVERFRVPGAMVICAHRGFLGIWKNGAAPFHVCDIAVNGLSFRNFGERLDEGATLKLIILLPNKAPIVVKAEVIWNKDQPVEGGNGVSQHTHVCGVKFTDYTANAWSVLSSTLEACERRAHSLTETRETDVAAAVARASVTEDVRVEAAPAATGERVYHPTEIRLA